MYSFKRIKNEVYVIHDETGVSLRYRDGKSLHPEWFNYWFYCMTKTERQMLYQQFINGEEVTVGSRVLTGGVRVPASTGNWPTGTVTIVSSGLTSDVRSANRFFNLANTRTSIKKEEEKDTTMFCNDTNIEITQRNFILATLQDAWYSKDTLKKDFYLEDDTPPRTAKDVIKRITDGLYVIPTNEYEDDDWDCPFGMIRWRDPAKKEDRDGYAAAVKQRKADFEVAKSTIILKDIVAGQAAMEEFKNKKYN